MSVKLSVISCIIALLGLIGCVADKEEPEWSLQPGDGLPAFEVVTLGGEKVSSSDSYQATMVIVFFNTTCVDCQRELPIIQRQYEENLKLPEAERSIYICISREEGAADVERYWTEHHLTMPVSPQTDRRIYSLFANIGIPRIFKAKAGKITDSTNQLINQSTNQPINQNAQLQKSNSMARSLEDYKGDIRDYINVSYGRNIWFD